VVYLQKRGLEKNAIEILACLQLMASVQQIATQKRRIGPTNSFQSRLGINLIYYSSLGVLFTGIVNDFSDGRLQH